MRSPIRRERLWILALVPLLAPLYSCAGAGGGGRAVNCDIVRMQRQEGLRLIPQGQLRAGRNPRGLALRRILEIDPIVL